MTARQVFVDGQRVTLAPAALLGQGGEAEVYDLGDGRVLKWWKPADHPDFDGLPEAQAQAKRRIEEAPARLRALPGNLPAAVVIPTGLALDRNKRVVGYSMPKVSGEPLHSYGEIKWRREHPVTGEDVVAVLLALHDAIAGLHRARVVIGDCNDLNVLVDGRRVHLIDVDSYQLPGFPCAMFTERFLDPRLCDGVMSPSRPHDEGSDWFAFATIAMRTFLGVGPWGGVHQPADPSKRCPPPARALRRISVLADGIVYPRAARPLAILPDDLLDQFRAIFERDQRGVFPRVALERLRLRACTQCGEEHARVRCPACQAQAHVPPAVVRGNLQVLPIGRDQLAFPYEIDRQTPIWIESGALWRQRSDRLGPERIGGVLANQTRAWVGEKLGVGLYRAGGYAVGFVFKPERGQLDDRVALPKIRGQLVAAHATLGSDRAWLWLTTSEQGRLLTTCVVIGADASVIASEVVDATWLAGITGACAAGPHLFVPTDEGIARVEVVQRAIVHTRTFAETAPFVGSGDRLSVSRSASIDVLRARDAVRLQLS